MKPQMTWISKRGIKAAAVAAVLVGCASAPLRTDKAASGIRAAEAVGASKVPQASLHLQLAREELALAKKLAEGGDEEKAASQLQRAEVDAELALALSREDAEKSEAEGAMERVRKLRNENNVSNEGGF